MQFKDQHGNCYAPDNCCEKGSWPWLNSGKEGQTAFAPCGSCWELTPAKITNYENTWSTDNPHIPLDPLNQKLYGVVGGLCPCIDTNKDWCCLQGENGPEGSAKTWNHFDIWFPDCTPGVDKTGGLSCIADKYCGWTIKGQPNPGEMVLQIVVEKDRILIARTAISMLVENNEKLGNVYRGRVGKRVDTLQNWNVKFKGIKQPKSVSDILTQFACLNICQNS